MVPAMYVQKSRSCRPFATRTSQSYQTHRTLRLARVSRYRNTSQLNSSTRLLMTILRHVMRITLVFLVPSPSHLIHLHRLGLHRLVMRRPSMPFHTITDTGSFDLVDCHVLRGDAHLPRSSERLTTSFNGDSIANLVLMLYEIRLLLILGLLLLPRNRSRQLPPDRRRAPNHFRLGWLLVQVIAAILRGGLIVRWRRKLSAVVTDETLPLLLLDIHIHIRPQSTPL